MAKGMSMEEFRNALSSEATVENDKLKAELEALKASTDEKISELTDERDMYKQWCVALGNRCMVNTHGLMCISCTVSVCPHALNSNDWDSINKFIRKNGLDIKNSAGDCAKVAEYIQTRKMKQFEKCMIKGKSDKRY